MKYLWTQNIEKPEFQSMSGDYKTDVLIIGGGMAGILCAYNLHNSGIDYMLVEGKTIGNGITKGTTAVLTAQHDVLYGDLIKKNGYKKAKMYLDANLKAVERYRKLAEKINCDFENLPSLIYSLTDRTQMENEAKALNRLGFNAQFTTEVDIPYKVAGAVKFPKMAQFHPLKFLYEISKGLNIYENTFVEKLEKTTAFTRNGKISAKRIIVATHYPFVNSKGLYFMKLFQQRSYVIAYTGVPPLNCTVMDVDENGMYLRSYKDLLVIGGGDHRTGKNGDGFKTITDFAQKYYPEAKEKYRWANQDCVSLDSIPYIGCYSNNLKNVYVASGFNLWGMTTSIIAAEVLTDIISGRKNEFSELYNPHRNILSPQLFKNIGETTINFLSPTTKRCSHLGCALKWNKVEHSWDCSCHGSRFDEKGKIIDNPAMKDIKVSSSEKKQTDEKNYDR